MIFKVGDTYTWSNTWYTGVPFGDHKIIIRVIHEDELAYTVEIVGRPFKISGGYKITEDRLLGENVKPKSATFDHDLHTEALQADLDAAKERYARLQAEHATLKILHEGALHMNGGFAQQVTMLTDRVRELESYFELPDIAMGIYQGMKVAVLVKGPRTSLELKAQYIEGLEKGKNIHVLYEEIDWIDPMIVTSVKHLQTLTDRIKELESSQK